MVRESSQEQFIPGCTVKDFFEFLYADSSAAKAYHEEVDKDDNAKVEPWTANTRTVHFSMPMQLPGVIKKLIGSSTIPVREIQRAETDSSGALYVTSTPLIGVPGGNKFQAVAKLTVTNGNQAGAFGVKVSANVICTANGPFGLVKMIEGVMVDQSATSVSIYLKFCANRCREKLIQKVPDALPDGLGSPTKSDATVFEQFFDAQEALSRSSSMNSTISDAGANLGPSTSEVVDTVALLKLLECLEGRLGSISSDLTAARALVPNPNPSVGSKTPCNASYPPQSRNTQRSWLMGGAGLLLGVSIGASVMFFCSSRNNLIGKTKLQQ